MKKSFSWSTLLLVSLLFVLVFPQVTSAILDEEKVDGGAAAPQTCNCILHLSGILCDLNQEVSFKIGNRVSGNDVLTAMGSQCLIVQSAIRSGYDVSRSFVLTEDACNNPDSIIPGGNSAGHQYSITCRLSGAAPKGMGDLHASDEDQIKTKDQCELRKANILATCMGGLDRNASDEVKIKFKADCETTASAEYRECLGGASTETKELTNDEVGFQLPDASGLNQFQGLSAQQVVGNLMATAMKIIGSIAFAMMVFAGFLWMTAAGNSDKERKARDIMVWSALGVIVILSSYSLVKLVFDAFAS